MTPSCAHDGGHSAVGRYLRGAGRLRFLLVCDACGAERGDVDSVAYRPNPRPYANHPAERIARALGIERLRAGRVRLAALPASDIPLEAAIVSVATAWESMTDDRPHRPALTPLLASRELVRGAGTQFDPAVVDAALSALAPSVPARVAA